MKPIFSTLRAVWLPLLLAVLLTSCSVLPTLPNPSSTVGTGSEATTTETVTTTPPTTADPETEPQETEPTEESLRATLQTLIPNLDEHYYLSRLSGKLLSAFLAVYQGVLDFRDYIALPEPLTLDELQSIVIFLEYDCPELFYFATEEGNYTFLWSDATNTTIKGFYPPYCMTKEEFETKKAVVESEIQALTDAVRFFTPYEAERYLFDYIVSSCTYSYEADEAHNPYGVLINGVARCEGFSRTFVYLLRELDIPCFSIFANSTTGDIAHSWNVVKLGDAYYDVDITHDITTDSSGNPLPNTYSHLNVTEEMHRSTYSLWLQCTLLGSLPDRTATAENYHIKNGAYATTIDEAKSIFKRLLSEGSTQEEVTFSIRFASPDDFAVMSSHVQAIVNDWYSENGIPFSYHYYWFEESQVYLFLVHFQ